jgi:hypothetical protein
MSLFNLVLGVHIACGTASIVAGGLALLTPKPVGGEPGRGHIRTGRLFLRAQTVVLIAAAVMTILHFRPYLVALTTTATMALFSGYRVLGRRRPDLHRSQRAQPLDWAVTLAAGAVGVWLLWLVGSGGVDGPATVVRVTTYTVLAYVAYDLVRFVWPLGFPFSPRLWLYEHLVKIVSAYFGAVAAFSGNALVFIPDPWRQLWATIVGETLVVVLLVRYIRYFRRAGSDGVARAA